MIRSTEVPVMTIPMGTGCDLSHCLGLNRELDIYYESTMGVYSFRKFYIYIYIYIYIYAYGMPEVAYLGWISEIPGLHFLTILMKYTHYLLFKIVCIQLFYLGRGELLTT